MKPRLIQVAYMKSLCCLRPKPASFESFGYMYVSMYICTFYSKNEYVYMYVCMYVCISPFLPQFHGHRINPSPVLVIAKSIQNNYYTLTGKVNTVSSSQEHSTIDKVDCGKLKAEKSCLCVENHVFTSEEYECKWSKKIPENMKQHVSQTDIRSNSWNSSK